MFGVIFGVLWLVFDIVGNWFLFQKAGKPGWHSLIPILNVYEEYDMCWKGSYGLAYLVTVGATSSCLNTYAQDGGMLFAVLGAVVGIASLVLHWIESMRLSQAFGKSTGYGIILFITDNLGRILLGLSSAEYRGKPRY